MPWVLRMLSVRRGSWKETLVVYHWDEAARRWIGFFPSLEDVPGLSTLATLTQGATYWVAVEEPVTWSIPLAGTP